MLGEWTYKSLPFKEPDGLLKEMQRLGITKSLVFDSRSWLYDIKSGNASIAEAVKGHEDSLIPVIALTPLIGQEFGGKQAVADFINKNRIGAGQAVPGGS